MRILVTGAAGFIGSHVAEALLARGDEVLGVDCLNDYYDIKQKEANLAMLEKRDAFAFLKEDIRDEEAMGRAFADFTPDAVIHLAARAGVRPSLEQPRLYYDVNLLGTLTLLEAARRNDVKTFLFGSSSSVYGDRKGGTFSETDRVDAPISPYAATKKAGEELCHAYHALHGIRIACLRFFTVYGPRGRPDMAPFKFVKWTLDGTPITRFGDGTTKRDYTYIADIVQGVVAALDAARDGRLGYEIINLGNDAPVALNDFIATVEKVTEKRATIKELPPQPGDVPYTCADIGKAKRLLGYAPTTVFEEGMRAFVAWYRSREAR